MIGYLIIGHFTPTDDDADETVQGKLDGGVQIMLAATREDADNALLWYQDGIIRELTIDIRRTHALCR